MNNASKSTFQYLPKIYHFWRVIEYQSFPRAVALYKPRHHNSVRKNYPYLFFLITSQLGSESIVSRFCNTISLNSLLEFESPTTNYIAYYLWSFTILYRYIVVKQAMYKHVFEISLSVWRLLNIRRRIFWYSMPRGQQHCLRN